jgi:hypothetical protein
LNHENRNDIPVSRSDSPFRFSSSAHLLRIGRERARTLGEFQAALRGCADGSIFYHTFRTLQEHHFIRQGFSNDFAHWTYAECNEAELAERLASLDVRRFTSVSDLRERIVATVDEHIASYPIARDRLATSPFYFCSSDTVTMPTLVEAYTLSEFLDALRHVSIHSIYYHFIEARLRLHLASNDFSQWLDEKLHLTRIAAALNRIDIYTSTLEGIRRQIIRVVQTAQTSTS